MTDQDMIDYLSGLKAMGAIQGFQVVPNGHGGIQCIMIMPIPAMAALGIDEKFAAIQLLMSRPAGSA